MKEVVRAIVIYEIKYDYFMLRLYYSDSTTELFKLAYGVRQQLINGGVPEGHNEWLNTFKKEVE